MANPELYEDSLGKLPEPWVAFRSDQSRGYRLYYHNKATSETTWERPQTQLPGGRAEPSTAARAFEHWREHAPLELPDKSPAQACEAFRDFCARLFPGGAFGRWGADEGVVWRLGEQESVGVLFCGSRRRVSVAYDAQQVGPNDLAAVGCMGAAARPHPGARLAAREKLAALGAALPGFAARSTAAATLTAPEAHLLRRYCAERGGEACIPSSFPSASSSAQGSEAVQHLAKYLRRFSLLFPVSCQLTRVGNFKTEAEFAEHLLSEKHGPYRHHLHAAVELLDEVSLSEWLPEERERYRSLLQWRDHMFQSVPMSDGCVLRFNHLTGLGTPSPESTWMALGQAPPPLAGPATGGQVLEAAASAAAPPAAAAGRGSRIWSVGEEPEQRLSFPFHADDLLATIRRSYGNVSGQQACQAPVDDVVEPPWAVILGPDGPYYHNMETNVVQWERPPLVEFETWSNHKDTRARDTPSDVFQKYHRMAPRPTRGPP